MDRGGLNPKINFMIKTQLSRMRIFQTTILAILSTLGGNLWGSPNGTLVFQSDFGVTDSYAAIMKAVAHSVSRDIEIFDIRHNIRHFDIREGARSLASNVQYWPKGTVFVSVVDPGVGTPRRSVVLKTKSGHYIVSPDNGSLSLVAEKLGIAAVREIDESVNRRPGTERSFTFHGRDVYSYTGARLAAGIISYEQVGPLREPEVVALPPLAAPEFRHNTIFAKLTGIDTFGNVGTNVDLEFFSKLEVGEYTGMVDVVIKEGAEIKYQGVLPFVRTYGEVAVGAPMVIHGSAPPHNMGLSINQASFAEKYKIETGEKGTVEFKKAAAENE